MKQEIFLDSQAACVPFAKQALETALRKKLTWLLGNDRAENKENQRNGHQKQDLDTLFEP